MEYRILIIKNNVKKIKVDKYLDWFKKNTPIEVVYDTLDTNWLVEVSKETASNDTLKAKLCFIGGDIREKIKSVVPEGKYNCVVLASDDDLGCMRPHGICFNTPLYPNTQFIQIFKFNDNGKTLNHELFHAFSFQANSLGANITDTLDTYIGNDNLTINDVEDTNREISLRKLEPHWDKVVKLTKPITIVNKTTNMYKPKNFTIKELVSPEIFNKYGEKAWEFFDERILKNLQFIRDNLGPITVNNTNFKYRGFDACEYRKDGVSQHNHGRAIDCNVVGKSAQEVRDWIIANQDKLPEPNCWIEDEVSWLHIDVRFSDKKGIYLFKV